MSAEIEAAGDFVTGAAVARAVEPDHGEAAGVANTCLNCGARMSGGYCQVCGQKAEVHRSLGAFWHDFTHSILHFEGKIWRTLPLLVLRPGELTRRYVHGERARFVSPLALFLFSVFLMFAVFSTVGLPVRVDPAFTDSRVRAESVKAMREELATARERLKELEQRQVLPGDKAAKQVLADARREERSLTAALNLAHGLSGGAESAATINTGSTELDARLREVVGNPQLLLYKMQSNGYKFSWALVLISLPFVWLAFAWKRRFHLFDHLVFVTYSLCFMTLLLVTGSVLTAIGLSGLVGWMIALAPPVHMFAQLRGAYSLSAMSALWRTVYLLVAAFVVLLIFGLLLLGLGI